MSHDRTVIVVSPQNTIWAVRFKSEEAAWRRLIALKNMRPGVTADKKALLAEGWKVFDGTTAGAK